MLLSYDISILGFLRSIHADSHSDCPHSHSQQQDLHVLLSPNPCWNLLVFVFLVIAIQMGMRKNLKMILISISLMVQDVEHLFKCYWPLVFLRRTLYLAHGFIY